jgi:hypothetical protein
MSDGMISDIRTMLSAHERNVYELFQIDLVLERRAALDDLPTRSDKIQKAIATARETDHLHAVVRNLHDMIRSIKRTVNQFVDKEDKIPELPLQSLIAKDRHLLDVYAALGVKWGEDIFSKIKYLREWDPHDLPEGSVVSFDHRKCECGHVSRFHFQGVDECDEDGCTCTAFKERTTVPLATDTDTLEDVPTLPEDTKS